ncbi:MAG: MarR family transcriptional regulator [Novosphingobium sp.]
MCAGLQKGPSTRDEHAGYDFETEKRDGKRDMAKVNSSDDENMPVGAGSSELRMWVRLLACAKIGEKQLRRRFDDEYETTLPRFDVLATLYRAPEGLRMSALSRSLLVSNGNVTVVVRQLQERGLVKSQVNPKDARSAIVSLTAAGKRHFLELAEAHHRWISEIFADVSDADKDDLVRMLGNLRTLMTEPR